MHRLTRFALLLVLATSLSAYAAEDTLRRSFNVSEGGTLIVDSDIGSVDVTTGGSNVSVEVVRNGDAEDLKKHEVTFNQSGNEIRIESRYPRVSGLHWGMDPRVRFNIRIPARFNVTLTTSGGSIEVTDLTGTAQCRTSGGHIRLGHINGPVHADTSGGSVSVESATAAIDAKTSGGSINIGNADAALTAKTSGGSIEVRRAGGPAMLRTSGGHIVVTEALDTLDANTSGGSIKATFARQPNGDCKLVTSGGSITVQIAPEVRFDVDAHTSGGSVSSEVPITVVGKVEKHALAGKLNGGGPKLEAKTSGGSVVLKQR